MRFAICWTTCVAMSAAGFNTQALAAGHGGGGHGGGGGGHSMGGGGGHSMGGGGHSFGGGGFSGGHISSGHAGSFGGAQHFGGHMQSAPAMQHHSQPLHQGSINHGGFNQGHLNQGHLGTIHNSAPAHNVFQGGATQHHQGTVHQGAVNHFGTQTYSGNAVNLHQGNSHFLQQHGTHQGQTHSGTAASTHHLGSHLNGLGGLPSGTSAHHGSQFLQHHAGNSGTGAASHTLHSNTLHSGSHNLGSHVQSNGLGQHRPTVTTASLSNSFLSHHHHAGSGLGNQAGNAGHHQHSGGVTAGKVNLSGSSLGALNHHHAGSNLGGNAGSLRSHHVGTPHQNIAVQNFRYGHHGHYSSRFWYGSGFGFGGFGYGLGSFGYGLGYGGFSPFGYGFGSPYYGFGCGRYPYSSYWGNSGYGYRGGFGYNGYGYGNCFAYQPVCVYQPVSYGYASLTPGIGSYSSVGLGLGASAMSYSPIAQGTMLAGPLAAADLSTSTAVTALAPQLAAADTKADIKANAGGALPSAEEYAAIGETSFKSRDYKSAIRSWRHGIVDDPDNGVLVLMLAQGLFASEQFNESAGATQFAMQLLPSEKWEVVVKNYRELYSKIDDYTTQLRALEKQAKQKPDDASLRFLLGYHYGFLGFHKEAVVQLEKCVTLAPDDDMAQKLLTLFQDKLPGSDKKEVPPTPGTSASTETPPSAGSSANVTLPSLSTSTLIPAPIPTPAPVPDKPAAGTPAKEPL